MTLYETLLTRGYIAQNTHEDEVKHLLNNEKIHFYIGFDPTADSLHVGHFLTIMAMSILQNHGHIPVLLIGGGTAMIGDPSGRQDMRKIMTLEQIQQNANNFKNQLSRFITFENNAAIMANNADWLRDINYINFLRDYGTHFSVNRMLTADAYKSRLDQGLTFLEFNYMILQAYDFLVLNEKYNCIMQLGGRDQWSNIIAGVDLIRRIKSKDAYGLTLSLLETSEGLKMGKTAKGALWLDKNKTTPYEFYQYFRNVDDKSVIKCLKLLTFVEDEKITELEQLKGKDINKAKILLAFEITKLVHGEEEALKAENAAKSLFLKEEVGEDSVPTITLPKKDISEGIDIITLLSGANLISSRSEGRRLILQNGIKINGTTVNDIEYNVSIKDILDNHISIQKGKKNFCKVLFD